MFRSAKYLMEKMHRVGQPIPRGHSEGLLQKGPLRPNSTIARSIRDNNNRLANASGLLIEPFPTAVAFGERGLGAAQEPHASVEELLSTC